MPTDLALLTGPAAATLLARAVRGSGWSLTGWRVTHVEYRPGLGVTAGYLVELAAAGGAAMHARMAASTWPLPVPVPVGTAVLPGPPRVGVWRFPHDPDLPGLAAAWDGGRAEIVVYRPRRRAVLRVPGAYVKVVRPHRASVLHERHRAAFAAGCPVPEPLGWSADGRVLLAELPGTTLRRSLARGGVPPAAEIIAVSRSLPEGMGEPRRTWSGRAGYYADIVATTHPALADRARAVADAVRREQAEGPPAVVHGDFHDGQVLVEGGRVTGLLDLDTAGPGDLLDDAACLLAHLTTAPARGPARTLARELLWAFRADLDAPALARRTAAVLLSLATSPRATPDRAADRVALAEHWLERAGRGG